ncbi:hypothetical protein K443DRAFT_652810 [Laccaria amethystina LaAM-08-1]|uniref:Uncharacterized protein n=1 Tax=Laccaria amethystina LaAM-08-1 TaxID=1095629 RepID=A0A0C9WND5_9AGAR|nr:hypothetical protein K443DRAFT_652810 [Laccaria amethystina LaAM-08-1]
MRGIRIDLSSSCHAVPLSRGQERGPPLPLASRQSTTDGNNLTFHALRRCSLTSNSWSILLPRHRDTSQPLTPYARLVA